MATVKTVKLFSKTILYSINVILLSLLIMSAGWKMDFAKAKTEAKETHKNILLNFSGSDWCIPCIKTKKEIFEKEIFEKYAEAHLILINADFPRLKKNSLAKEQVKKNEALAEQYNKDGVFPFTLLISPDGKILKEWRGYPDITPEIFISQIRAFEQPAN